MAKFLDEDGLKHLWEKIDTRFDAAETNISANSTAIGEIGYSISYDSDLRKIKLLDKSGNQVGESIDASAFIKDGMLEDVELITVSVDDPVEGFNEGDVLFKFTWNADAAQDPKIDYVNVSDLSVKPETDNTTLTEAITVTGVTVGNLTNGYTINAGTKLQDILEMILMKELFVKSTTPKVTISNSGTTAKTYEVGTEITVNLSHTYTDGYFSGEEGYDYTLAAGCTEGDTTYYKSSTALTGNTDIVTLTEGSVDYKCTTTYGVSTNIPVSNLGNNLDTTIVAGTATSGNITFTGKYKYFLGYGAYTTIAELDSAKVRALTTKTGDITKDGTTTVVGSTAIKSNGTSIIIACPAKYKLATISNGLGADILANFFVTGNVDVNLGGGTGAAESYNVYIYPITNGAEVEFKNVTLTKAQ